MIGHTGFKEVRQDLRSRLIEKIGESGEEKPEIISAPTVDQPYGILPQLIHPPEETLSDISNPERYMKPWEGVE